MNETATNIVSHGEAQERPKPLFRVGYIDFACIPLDLRDRPQWVVWRYGVPKKGGGYKKVPYSPTTGKSAKSNNPATWATFERARTAYIQGVYDGIGYMLSSDDPYIALDFDHCYDGQITDPTIAAFVARFASYTELSPSGTGLHVYLHATAPEGNRKQPGCEVIAAKTFITVTGQRLPGTPALIEARQEDFDAWYAERFPRRRARRAAQPDSVPTTTDEAIIRRVMDDAKGKRLWAGDTTDYLSPSEADLALINLIARSTRVPEQIERIFRQSGLLSSPKRQQKWDRADYSQLTIEKALEASITPHRREYRRVSYAYDWRQRIEAPGWREKYLRDKAIEGKRLVEAHIKARSQSLLAIALPPGVGKTRVISTLGDPYDIAWVAIRRDLYKEVSKSATYRFIERCQEDNCPDAERMNWLSSKGRTPMKLHRQHDSGLGCGYYLQFQGQGSAFYRAEHLPSSYVGEHDAVIVDELEVSRWLRGIDIDDGDIAQARRASQWEAPYLDPVRNLLRTLYDVLIAAKGELYGRALFAALHAASEGRVGDWIRQAYWIEQVMDERPQVHDEDDIPELERDGRVIVPFIVRWLLEDLPKWEAGGDWNSRAHIYVYERKPHLRIITPLRPAAEVMALLDATASDTILSRLVGRSVHSVRQEITPPPNTRHIAVRTQTKNGRLKGYGKRSLVGKERMGATEKQRVAEEQGRTARAIKYVMEREGVTGSVGIITHEGCEEVLGDALGIPVERRDHFYNVRGSNAYEDCDVLVLVGTPTPNLGEVEWWARALYADDPEPIQTAQVNGRYIDPRLFELLDYLVNSELTQAAHRNRPIRHDGRTVISFTSGEIDYLPITEEITELPYFPTKARDDQATEMSRDQKGRLDQAYEAILARGEEMSVRLLAREARVKTKVAGDYLRARRG